MRVVLLFENSFFFTLENGVLISFYGLKFTNFLKDVIFYVKQLKFMAVAHIRGVSKLFY